MIRGIPSEMDPQAGICFYFKCQNPWFVCLFSFHQTSNNTISLSVYLSN